MVTLFPKTPRLCWQDTEKSMTRKFCLSQLASMAPESTMQASREKRRQCSPVLALRVTIWLSMKGVSLVQSAMTDVDDHLWLDPRTASRGRPHAWYCKSCQKARAGGWEVTQRLWNAIFYTEHDGGTHKLLVGVVVCCLHKFKSAKIPLRDEEEL